MLKLIYRVAIPLAINILILVQLVSCSPIIKLDYRKDSYLQNELSRIIDYLNLNSKIKNKNLTLMVADITNDFLPFTAGFNETTMMYAASIPKILILLAILKKVESGEIDLNENIINSAKLMIRASSNEASNELISLVGPQFITVLALERPFYFYDIINGGGLWLGKGYDDFNPAWQRDPLKNLSHGANALSITKFYYYLITGKLLNPRLTSLALEIFSNPELDHKFVYGLSSTCPQAIMYRKSGSWKSFHSDSAIVEHDGIKYIIVALAKDKNAPKWMPQLMVEIDALILAKHHQRPCYKPQLLGKNEYIN
jgi:beta-lactamase class A